MKKLARKILYESGVIMLTDPYQILEVPEDATDETIKQHYLNKVKAYPPEHCPEMFEKVRAAFEAIATQYKRLSYALLTPPTVTKQDLLDLLVQSDPVRRLKIEELLRLLNISQRETHHGC